MCPRFRECCESRGRKYVRYRRTQRRFATLLQVLLEKVFVPVPFRTKIQMPPRHAKTCSPTLLLNLFLRAALGPVVGFSLFRNDKDSLIRKKVDDIQ